MKAAMRVLLTLMLTALLFSGQARAVVFEPREDGMYPGRYTSNAIDLGTLQPESEICDTVNTFEWCLHKFQPETVHYALTLSREMPLLVTTYGSEVRATDIRVRYIDTIGDTVDVPCRAGYDYKSLVLRAEAWDDATCHDSQKWFFNGMQPGRYLIEVHGVYTQGYTANGLLRISFFGLTSDNQIRAPSSLLWGTREKPYFIQSVKPETPFDTYIGKTLSAEYVEARRGAVPAIYFEFAAGSRMCLTLDTSGSRTRMSLMRSDAESDTLLVRPDRKNDFIIEAGRWLMAVSDSAGMQAGSEIYIRMQLKPLPEGHPLRYVRYDPAVAGHNYMVTRTMLGADGSRWVDDVQHYDGLGRQSQKVALGASPTGGNIVTVTDYDGDGQPWRQWLPAVTDAPYARVGSVDYPAVYSGERSAFSETLYEAASTGRPSMQYGPGRAWRDAEICTGHVYTVSESSNPDLCVQRYTAGNPTGLHVAGTVSITGHGAYPDGALTVIETTDESGRRSLEFSDYRGEKVLERRVIAAGSYADTYYIRDGRGNLTAVLTPEASARMRRTATWVSDTSQVLRSWAYLYNYNQRGLMTSSQDPGGATTIYRYDTTHRLVLSRDGNLDRQHRWRFEIADVFGRVCLTGTCAGSFSEFALLPRVRAVRDDSADSLFGYHIEGLTLEDPHLLTVSYYDDYSFLGSNGCPSEQTLGFVNADGYGTSYSSARGQLTGTVVFESTEAGAEMAQHVWTALYYDSSGRVIQTAATNRLGGIDREMTAWDFAGRAVATRTHHTSSMLAEPLVQTVSRTFDDFGRTLTETHCLTDAAEPVTLSAMRYDAVGRLAGERLGRYQQRTYTRDIRSRLTAITSSYFTQTLAYTPGGDISAMSWRAFGPSETERTYRFSYDPLARLTAAFYTDADGQTGAFDTAYDYDLNGNITSLSRTGVYDRSAWSTVIAPVDELQMTYSGGRLVKVTDACSGPFYQGAYHYVDGADEEIELTYDANGNTNADADRGIASTLYDVNNRPRRITFADGSQTRYVYDGTGALLRTAHYVAALQTVLPGTPSVELPSITESPGGAAKTATDDLAGLRLASVTDYAAGGIIYEDSVATRINLPCGYVQLRERGQMPDAPRYNFYLRDHQGNNRMVVDDSEGVRQIIHYYPYGLPMGCGYRAGEQRYNFSGKEIDRTSGLDLLDFHARFYDPALIRFRTPDPLATKFYPLDSYSYCANSPLLHIDPTGMKIVFDSNCDDDFKEKFNEAWQILKDHNAADNLDYLDAIDAEITILNSNEQDLTDYSEAIRFIPSTNTIKWTPYLGVVTSQDMYYLTPTELLQHESDHAQRYQREPDEMDIICNQTVSSDSKYGTIEERRVILGSETQTAIKLGKLSIGQITRPDHGGTLQRVNNVYSTYAESGSGVVFFAPNKQKLYRVKNLPIRINIPELNIK